MAKFCTRCGTQNDAEALFCESCGSPLRPAAAPQAVPSQPAAAPAADTPAPAKKASGGNKKLLLILGGIALLTVILAAVGAFMYFASPKRASEAHFVKAVENYYAADKSRADDLTCLNNLPYGKDPMITSAWDGNTNGWMKLLVEEGLYEAPQAITSGGYFVIQQQYSYALTETGKKAVRGNLLCFADGIKVRKALKFTPPKEAEKTHAAQIEFAYELVNPAAWTKNPAIRQYMGRDLDNLTESKQVVLKKAGWVVGSSPDDAPEASASQSSGGGFLSWLGNLFNRNPLAGKWRSDAINVSGVSINPGLEYEFTSSEMRTQGAVVKVKYDIKDDTVTVFPENANGAAGQIFRVVDKDHIALEVPFMGKITFSRVKD